MMIKAETRITIPGISKGYWLILEIDTELLRFRKASSCVASIKRDRINHDYIWYHIDEYGIIANSHGLNYQTQWKIV